jgi:hypothetical protein
MMKRQTPDPRMANLQKYTHFSGPKSDPTLKSAIKIAQMSAANNVDRMLRHHHSRHG